VTNACVVWTTTYLGYAIDDDADPVSTEVIAHPSPACYGHINPYGTYTFNEESPPPTDPPAPTTSTTLSLDEVEVTHLPPLIR
jgi:hypothetical protein